MIYTRDQVSEWDSDLLVIFNDLTEDKNDHQHDICRTRTLQEFMSHEDFLSDIEISVNKSRGEIFLMILEYSLKYKLSLNEIISMLQQINLTFSRLILPDARWIVDNILNPKDKVEFHGICPICCKYIGKINDVESCVTCDVCSEIINLENPSSSNIFIMIDPTENIKILLEENAEYYDNVIKLRTFNGKIRNIFDGNMYKSFIKKLPESDKHNYVTTIFNTDGAPKFESSNYSIWPIYLQLNEIPIQTKLNRIITCGIWFGRNKPEITAFLHPFTEMMTTLTNQDITCRINNEERLIKVTL